MADAAIDRAHWSRVAAEWIAWARKPGHDVFWAYRAPLAEFIGRSEGEEALDVGCGEGRVSRLLGELGWRVSAADTVAELVAAAEAANSAAEYVVADAADLPFTSGRFSLVVAYNMLMDVKDVPAALGEIRRVMHPEGTLVISLVHPFFDRGAFVGPEPDSPFVLARSYFGRERFEGAEERDGLTMHFAGWSQPLEAYAAALSEAGFAMTALREPLPAPESRDGRMRRWTRVPLFLWLKARPIGERVPG